MKHKEKSISRFKQAIMIFDLDKERFVDCNRHTPQMFACHSKEEIFAQPISIFRRYKAMDLEPKMKDKGSIIEEFLNSQEGFLYESTLTRLDGTPFDVEFNVVKDISEEKRQLLIFLSDITERKNKEKELLKAKEKAEQSDKLKSAFLANMSHEIRTPMNGIVGFSAMLLEQNLEEEKKQEFAVIINDCCNQLLNIVNNVLDLAKIQTEAIEVHEEDVDLNSLLSETVNMFQLEAADKNIYLRTDLPKNATSLYTDGLKLRQIITNLLSNAIKFTEKGGVELGYKLKDGQVELYIQDTGIGISKTNQTKIFQRFQRVGATINKVRGAGLGLAICKGFADVLNGTLNLESEENRGSIFYLSIPYKPTATVYQAPALPKISPRKIEILRGKTILIAEDEVYNFKLLNNLLLKYGLQILWAKNGQEAVEMSEQHPEIDLILMDMKMPIMNGIEATKIIQKKSTTPIVAQSAQAFQDEKEAILSAGCVAHLAKPIQREELLETMIRFLCNEK